MAANAAAVLAPLILPEAAAVPVQLLGPIVRVGLGRVVELAMSLRGRQRVLTAMDTALVRIKADLDLGFEPNPLIVEPVEEAESQPAAALLEGTLMAALRSYEEGKVPILGELYAAIAFDHEFGVHPESGSMLIDLVQQLRYRQLVLLAVIGKSGGESFNRLGLIDDSLWIDQSHEALTIAIELRDLQQRGLIQVGLPRAREAAAPHGAIHLPPARISLSRLGIMLHDLAALYRLPDEQLDAAASLWDGRRSATIPGAPLYRSS